MPDTHFLSAALGWMELGNCTEAKAELTRVSPALATHPTVLEVNWAVFAAERNWVEALRIAELLVTCAEDHATGWLHRAYAMRRAPGGGLQAAWDCLMPAAERFPKEATIPYNLACYACQMNQLDEARRWLRLAIAVGDKTKLKSMAISDSDLEALWPEMKSF